MATELLAWLGRGALATTAALLLVLVLRGLVRRRFGAGVAYGLWLLVPAALLAVSLPAPGPDIATAVVGAGTVAPADPLPSVRVGMATALQPVVGLASGTATLTPAVLATAWGLGAMAMLLWLCRLQRRFVSSLGGLTRRDDGVFVAASPSASPAAVGLLRARIVLPADFFRRYSDDEAALIVAHECEHVRRGDIRINGCVAALRCLFWFNPLLHWAASRFRFDQELACDAAVLARHPHSRRAYADAMLKTQLAVLGLPVGCHWQSSQSLKERILMLKRPLPGRTRARLGAFVVCCAIAFTGFAAWATQPSSVVAPPAQRGYFHEHGVAFAHVHTPKEVLSAIRISGPSMGPDEDPQMTRVVLNRYSSLSIASADSAGPWELRLLGVGAAGSPEAEWKLLRGERVEAQGRQPIPASGRSVLSVASDSMPALPRIELSRLPEDGVVGFPAKEASHPAALTREPDGSWLDGGGSWAIGDIFGANGGRAVLLAHVGADGRVQRVEVERADPPGSLSQAAATDLLKNNVYTPQRVDGKAVPSRVRVPISYSRDDPEHREPVFASASPTPGADTPAPTYPKDALEKKIGGFVMLHLLVTADGKVKDVRVVTSTPKGVFEEVSIEAAKKWALQPPIKDGKPVEGWVQVPITFEPNRPKAEKPAQG